jgi:hypothetical protein
VTSARPRDVGSARGKTCFGLADIGDGDIHAMLVVVFVVTALVGLFVSNSATAVLIGPIAIDAAKTSALRSALIGSGGGLSARASRSRLDTSCAQAQYGISPYPGRPAAARPRENALWTGGLQDHQQELGENTAQLRRLNAQLGLMLRPTPEVIEGGRPTAAAADLGTAAAIARAAANAGAA